MGALGTLERLDDDLIKVPSPGASRSHRLDADLIAGLRQAEAAIRRHHRTRVEDPSHPTITELSRLEAELVTASLGPLLHALVEMTIAADVLDAVFDARGAPAAASV